MFLRKLISPPDNIQDTAWQYAQILNLQVTRGTLRQIIDEHPDYPSMLALHDAFETLGVETLAVRINKAQLADVDIPLIAQIRLADTHEELFTIVKPEGSRTFTYLHPK